MKSGIYKITNILNDKSYIGLSYNIKQRWKHHKCLLNKNKHHNLHLQSAWNKYGKKYFTFKVLEYCDLEVLPEREIYWIDYYSKIIELYNQADGGGGGNGLCGENHPAYKDEIYTFYNEDGRIEKDITALDMTKKYNLGDSHIYEVIKGTRNQVFGWRITKDKEWLNYFNFYHISGIEELHITQIEMVRKYKVDSGSIYRVVVGEFNQTKGWFISKEKMQKYIDNKKDV